MGWNMPASRCSYCGSSDCSDDCRDIDGGPCFVCDEFTPEPDLLAFGKHWRCLSCEDAGLVATCVCCGEHVPFVVPEGGELLCLTCVKKLAEDEPSKLTTTSGPSGAS